MIDVMVGMAMDGPCLVAVADGQDRCMAKASGSTPALAAAYLCLAEEDSCTT
jgi:hypothetical protein